MSNLKKVSARRQAQGALERPDELEQTQAQFMFATQRAVGTLQNQLSHATEVVDALVSILGAETVTDAIEQNRINKANEMAEARKQSVVTALEEGKLVVEEKIRPAVAKKDEKGEPVRNQNGLLEYTDAGSFVASIEFDADGNEIPGSYYCLPMSNIKEEFQPKLEGQAVGAEVVTSEPKKDEKGEIVLNADGKPAAGKVVILGVYSKVEPKLEAVPAPVAEQTISENAEPAKAE